MASRASRSPRPATSTTRKPAQAAAPPATTASKGSSPSSPASAKAATPRATVPKSGPKSAPKSGPERAVVAEAPVTGASELTKKELIDTVLERSEVKKKFAKPVVEAMIEVIGDAIATGREINLQPMGKIKPQRTKDSAKARVVIAKIRQNKPATGDAGTAGEGVTDNSKRTVADDAE